MTKLDGDFIASRLLPNQAYDQEKCRIRSRRLDPDTEPFES